MRWAKDPDDDRMRAEFYPTLAKSQLFFSRRASSPAPAPPQQRQHRRPDPGQNAGRTPADVQPRAGAGGSTAPAGRRYADNSIDMGTGYDCFESLSRTRTRSASAARSAATG